MHQVGPSQVVGPRRRLCKAHAYLWFLYARARAGRWQPHGAGWPQPRGAAMLHVEHSTLVSRRSLQLNVHMKQPRHFRCASDLFRIRPCLVNQGGAQCCYRDKRQPTPYMQAEANALQHAACKQKLACSLSRCSKQVERVEGTQQAALSADAYPPPPQQQQHLALHHTAALPLRRLCKLACPAPYM